MAKKNPVPTHVAIFCVDGEAHMVSFNKNDIESMFAVHPHTRENVEVSLGLDASAAEVFEQLKADVEDISDGKIITKQSLLSFAEKCKSLFPNDIRYTGDILNLVTKDVTSVKGKRL